MERQLAYHVLNMLHNNRSFEYIADIVPLNVDVVKALASSYHQEYYLKINRTNGAKRRKERVLSGV